MIYVSSLDKIIFASTGAVGNGAKYSNQYLRSTNGAVPTNTVKINYNGVAKNQGYLTWKNPSGATCRNVMQVSTAETKYTYSYTNSTTTTRSTSTTVYFNEDKIIDVGTIKRNYSWIKTNLVSVTFKSYYDNYITINTSSASSTKAYSRSTYMYWAYNTAKTYMPIYSLSYAGQFVGSDYYKVNGVYWDSVKVIGNSTYTHWTFDIASMGPAFNYAGSSYRMVATVHYYGRKTSSTTFQTSTIKNNFTTTQVTTYNYNSKSTSSSTSGTKTA